MLPIKFLWIVSSVLCRVVKEGKPVQYVVWMAIDPAMNVPSKQNLLLLVLVVQTRIALHGPLEIGLR